MTAQRLAEVFILCLHLKVTLSFNLSLAISAELVLIAELN